MANVLTAEYVEQSTRAINSWLGGESGFVNELRDSHEAIRAERDEARRERDEATASRDVTTHHYNALCVERDEWRGRAERAEAALRDAEQCAREFTHLGATCFICRVHADREFGRVSVTIPHRPTCPFRVLAEREPTARFAPPASCSSQCFRDGQWIVSQDECGCYDDWLWERATGRKNPDA